MRKKQSFLNASFRFAFFLFVIIFSKTIFSQTPDSPEISYVSVNPETQKPVIAWTHSAPETIDGYIIKRLIYTYPGVVNNTFNTIIIINNQNQNYFEDTTTVYGKAMPSERQEIYRIVAFKYSGNDMFMSLMSEPHKTMVLQVEYDYCSESNKLTWNKYDAWNEISEYKIYAKTSETEFLFIGNILPPDTIFTHKNILNKNYYYYLIAVKNNQIQSYTNIFDISVNSLQMPEYLKINSLIVSNNNSLEINFEIDENAEIEKYNLLKSNEKYKNFVIKNEFYDTNTNIIKYTDTEFEKEKLNYYYLAGEDYCENVVIRSDTVSNIVLNTNKKETENYINELIWTNFNIDNYEIFRSFNSGNYEIINTVNDYFFEDNIFEFYENQFINETTSGKFCYFIKSYDNEKNRIYKSNTDCLNQKPTVFIANAFNPNSNIEENRIFKPKIAFVNEYLLVIYTRTGIKIFETNNPDEGWDGKINGEISHRATYFYFLTYKNSRQEKILKKGYISVLSN